MTRSLFILPGKEKISFGDGNVKVNKAYADDSGLFDLKIIPAENDRVGIIGSRYIFPIFCNLNGVLQLYSIGYLWLCLYLCANIGIVIAMIFSKWIGNL